MSVFFLNLHQPLKLEAAETAECDTKSRLFREHDHDAASSSLLCTICIQNFKICCFSIQSLEVERRNERILFALLTYHHFSAFLVFINGKTYRKNTFNILLKTMKASTESKQASEGEE